MAIFFRSNEKYSSALQMFMALLDIQTAMYGTEGESLIYTYKNIGICYMA